MTGFDAVSKLSTRETEPERFVLSMEDTVKIENRYVNLSTLTLDETDVLMGEDAAFGTYQWTQWTTYEIFVYNDSDATKLTDFSEGHFLLAILC